MTVRSIGLFLRQSLVEIGISGPALFTGACPPNPVKVRKGIRSLGMHFSEPDNRSSIAAQGTEITVFWQTPNELQNPTDVRYGS